MLEVVKQMLQIQDMFNTQKKVVYLVSDCVICGHRKSRFIKSNYKEPANSSNYGKNPPFHVLI